MFRERLGYCNGFDCLDDAKEYTNKNQDVEQLRSGAMSISAARGLLTRNDATIPILGPDFIWLVIWNFLSTTYR